MSDNADCPEDRKMIKFVIILGDMKHVIKPI